uniref:Reverse transcriptase domain-containing protein n=1 Tax=Anolis carolinensis TaxID=28377 RepID=A0A803T1Q9_ANOCA
MAQVFCIVLNLFLTACFLIIAFIVNNKVAKAMIGYNPKNDRMISIQVQGKPFNIAVIQIYAPTTAAEEAELGKFYEDLQHLLDNTPKKDIILITGDWNAKVGSQMITGITGKHGLGQQNEAGGRLIEFCQENSLCITNTLFQQPKRWLYTWTSPDGQHRNQIEYILCSQRWRTSIHLVKTRPGADCSSDHELLIAKFRIKLKRMGEIHRPIRYDLTNIPSEYAVEVKNRFQGLDLINRVPEELWTEVHNIVQEAATKYTPKKKKTKKARWLSAETLEVAQERRKAKGNSDRGRYAQLNAQFQRLARRDKELFLNKQCMEVEDNRIGRTRDLFQKIRNIRCKFQAKMGMIKNKDGRDLTEAEEIKKRWREYTEDLYRKDNNIENSFDSVVNELKPDILRSEVEWALRSIANNKAAGDDGIPAELFKILEGDAVKVMHAICQKIWKTQDWPSDWKKSIYIPIPKKGNAKECSNFRTVAHISLASKVMLKILQGRLQQYMERELPDVQAGFRKGRGTRDQIANIRWIMEEAREFQKNIYFCFIDYSKAFDYHNKLWHVLGGMGIPSHLVCLLRNLYKDQVATSRTDHGTTDWFQIGKGVRQGCILSPSLFNLYAEHIMRHAGLGNSKAGVKIAGRNIKNNRCADDTTLMAESEEELRSLITKVKEESAKAGLQLNIKKTKIMATTSIDFKRADFQKMKEILSGILWTPILKDKELKDGWEFLKSEILKAQMQTVPTKKKI